MRKTYLYINILTCLLLGLFACENEYIIPDSTEPNHLYVTTSENAEMATTVQIGNNLSFSDFSRGVLTREWIFPSETADILNSDNDTTSAEHTVHATFLQAGVHEVVLNHQFADSVWVEGEKLAPVQQTTFTVTVLEKVIADFMANYMNDGIVGDALTHETGALNEVNAGKIVRFTQNTVGSPTNYEWEFEGGAITSEDPSGVVDVRYKKTGTYDVRLIAYRENPMGRDTLLLEDYITVIPSTDPVTLDGITEMDDKIALNFSRDMDNPSGEIGNFSVRIKNGDNVITPTVTDVSLDANELNVVLLTIDNQIYNSDSVFVSYNKGELSTSDGVEADAFTDKALTFNLTNIAPADAAGLESIDSWGAWGVPAPISISSTQAYSGNSSLHFNVTGEANDPALGWALVGRKLGFSLEQGKKYGISYMVYVESTDATAEVGFFLIGDWGQSSGKILSNVEANQWVEVKKTDYLANNANERQLLFRVRNGNASVYVDNVFIYEIEERPL